MSLLTTQNLEIFVTDFLKEDLKQIELHINKYNEQIMEYVQLRNTLQTLHENSYGSFKTQMNIGGNIFMEAKVNNPDDLVLVDVGKGYFVQFTLAEALKFSNFKVKILTKECDVLREESVKKRSDIKLALMCIADQENLYAEQK
ncbi:protein UXT-like isoform X1 [Rhagoletis pomonella]|uniref:protein UXT-like isoform X1 n=1 Tax=Rhagoletis pomonella TaxID=28610 RepID=UPI00177F9268|nr:protein UXT-like isoform X1 [Rhagoletis pomonella]